ncbi:MAG: tetratricopeptide repeat protein [Planctomycetaceae bacterium]|nr:tetratricopeptide repeat protein [Planctomycetaceae bacterium]
MPQLLSRLLCVVVVALWGTTHLWGANQALADDALTAARQLWLGGKYAEAQEAYETLKPDHAVEAALGVARCQVSRGQTADARETLAAAQKQQPDNPALAGLLAQLAFESGQYDECDRLIAAILKTKPDDLLARWLHAERLRLTGKLDEADKAYNSFVEYYNDHDVTEPDDLRLVGLAAAQFARWNKLSDQFTFLVNDLYPDALQQSPHYWPAHYEAGRLYAEKYNEPEARREYQAALKLNPNAAEVYAAVAQLALQRYDLDDALRAAERALEINPQLLDGKLALADVHIANLSFDEARETLEAARPLNPQSEPLLGRLVGVYAILDALPSTGPAAGTDTRFTKLLHEAATRNPHCGEFYFALGATFDLARRYPLAARYYRAGVERLPRSPLGYGVLGMTYMRLGEEVEAKRWLDQSFERDPFNVRVSNTLKVLEVLENYAVIETEHFVLKFDRIADEILVRYAARYLEEHVYPDLCQQLQYKPEGKSLFEVFNRAKNTRGHGWFSARMVGLPSIGTVGACAGKMVALASPNDMPQKYNWARVLKHEFVHVLNLQQTDFCIPHWYTEALAVESEGGVRPPTWDAMLARRVPKGETFNLDTINLGFVRPKSGEDWQMAYCQAQLYAQYMRATYGPDATARMLAAYSDHLSTRQAIKRSFAVEQ